MQLNEFWEALNQTKQMTKMKLMPLCMYIELHDLMYLLALQKGDYDVDISLESDNSNVEQT